MRLSLLSLVGLFILANIIHANPIEMKNDNSINDSDQLANQKEVVAADGIIMLNYRNKKNQNQYPNRNPTKYRNTYKNTDYDDDDNGYNYNRPNYNRGPPSTTRASYTRYRTTTKVLTTTTSTTRKPPTTTPDYIEKERGYYNGDKSEKNSTKNNEAYANYYAYQKQKENKESANQYFNAEKIHHTDNYLANQKQKDKKETINQYFHADKMHHTDSGKEERASYANQYFSDMIKYNYDKNNTHYPWPVYYPASIDLIEDNKTIGNSMTSNRAKYFIRNKAEDEDSNAKYSRTYYDQYAKQHQEEVNDAPSARERYYDEYEPKPKTKQYDGSDAGYTWPSESRKSNKIYVSSERREDKDSSSKPYELEIDETVRIYESGEENKKERKDEEYAKKRDNDRERKRERKPYDDDNEDDEDDEDDGEYDRNRKYTKAKLEIADNRSSKKSARERKSDMKERDRDSGVKGDRKQKQYNDDDDEDENDRKGGHKSDNSKIDDRNRKNVKAKSKTDNIRSSKKSTRKQYDNDDEYSDDEDDDDDDEYDRRRERKSNKRKDDDYNRKNKKNKSEIDEARSSKKSVQKPYYNDEEDSDDEDDDDDEYDRRREEKSNRSKDDDRNRKYTKAKSEIEDDRSSKYRERKSDQDREWKGEKNTYDNDDESDRKSYPKQKPEDDRDRDNDRYDKNDDAKNYAKQQNNEKKEPGQYYHENKKNDQAIFEILDAVTNNPGLQLDYKPFREDLLIQPYVNLPGSEKYEGNQNNGDREYTATKLENNEIGKIYSGEQDRKKNGDENTNNPGYQADYKPYKNDLPSGTFVNLPSSEKYEGSGEKREYTIPKLENDNTPTMQ